MLAQLQTVLTSKLEGRLRNKQEELNEFRDRNAALRAAVSELKDELRAILPNFDGYKDALSPDTFFADLSLAHSPRGSRGSRGGRGSRKSSSRTPRESHAPAASGTSRSGDRNFSPLSSGTSRSPSVSPLSSPRAFAAGHAGSSASGRSPSRHVEKGLLKRRLRNQSIEDAVAYDLERVLGNVPGSDRDVVAFHVAALLQTREDGTQKLLKEKAENDATIQALRGNIAEFKAELEQKRKKRIHTVKLINFDMEL